MRIRVKLELDVAGPTYDGKLYFWDAAHGRDVVCDVRGGRLVRRGKQISLADMAKLIERRLPKDK